MITSSVKNRIGDSQLTMECLDRYKPLEIERTLYKVDRTKHYGRLDEVFQGTVDLALIREQWDQLVRVAASLRNRTAPAHIVLQRLASSAPSDRLAKALTALGRALKSLYLLRYIQDIELRGRMQLQLNRGERRHQLARRLFFANQGAFQIGDYEEIMNKATCLSLLSNAVVVWNTVQMTRIIDQLRAGGERITDEELAVRRESGMKECDNTIWCTGTV